MIANSNPSQNPKTTLHGLSFLGFAYAASDIQELGIWMAVGIAVLVHLVVSVFSALVVRAILSRGRRIPFSNRPFVWLFNAGIFYLLMGPLILGPILRGWGLSQLWLLLGYGLLVLGMNWAMVRRIRKRNKDVG